uniref:CARD domain-containing protein n=1 Tax=Labrus bergylta TaxID=56723 RepID=A0A3Q3F6Q5_9LABR
VVHQFGPHNSKRFEYTKTARVNNIGPILDKLLEKGVIRQEVYDKIRDTPTTQDKMRKLYRGPLRAGGQKAKDVFYQILEEEESYLVDDLKRKESGAGAIWN